MAPIDDAVRRTRAAIADYDATRKGRARVVDAFTGSLYENAVRYALDADVEVATAKIVGATEYLLSIITQERDTL